MASCSIIKEVVRALGLDLAYLFKELLEFAMVSLQTAFPEGSVIRLGDTVNTANSVVAIFGEWAVKKTEAFTDAEILTKLHSEIRRSQVDCLCSPQADLEISRGGMLTARIGPVGFCGKMPVSKYYRDKGCRPSVVFSKLSNGYTRMVGYTETFDLPTLCLLTVPGI